MNAQDVTTILAALSDYLTVDRMALLYFVFNCAVQALPDPNGGKVYRFFYQFFHLLAGNTNVVRKAGKEGDIVRPVLCALRAPENT